MASGIKANGCIARNGNVVGNKGKKFIAQKAQREREMGIVEIAGIARIEVALNGRLAKMAV